MRIASAYRSLGRLDAAVAALEEAKKHCPEDVSIAAMLSECSAESKMLKTLGVIEPPPTLTSPAARDAIQYAAKLSKWDRSKMAEYQRRELSHELYMAPLNSKSTGDQTLWWKAFITHPSDPLSKLEEIVCDSSEVLIVRKELRELIGAAAMWFAKVYVLYERSSRPMYHPLVKTMVKLLSSDTTDIKYGMASEIHQMLSYDAQRWGNIGASHPRPPTQEQCERSMVFARQFVNLGAVDKLIEICVCQEPSIERT
jgi:hypothetical protein